jgi:hypothetical protein
MKMQQLEKQMAAMKINTDANYKPKYGQDPALFNQIYMEYISKLG